MLENIRESAVVWNNAIFKHLVCALSHRTLYVHYFIEVLEQLHQLGNCYYLHFRDEEKDTESKQFTQGHIAKGVRTQTQNNKVNGNGIILINN